MTAFPWWAWMILAGGLGLAEMGVPGAYLMWIALGATLTGALDASAVFDLVVDLEGAPDGYVAMDTRKAVKVRITP